MAENPQVLLSTSKGDITVELFADEAPITIQNFLSYVDAGFYNGTIFHRVIPGFMAQGGGFTPDMQQKSANDQIKNEATNGLKNDRGTLAMARTSVVDSASAQFFINLIDNDFLNHKSTAPNEFGYCVFGKVVSGTETVDAMATEPTSTQGMHQNVPSTPILINAASRV